MAGSSLEMILVCVECKAESKEGARGWRAFLTDSELEPEEVAVYCAGCARQEFGDAC